MVWINYLLVTLILNSIHVFTHGFTGGYYRESSYRALGVMAATWCFATFVFVNVYSSCLTVYTSLTFQRPDINSLLDLAENPNYQLITIISSAPEIEFLVIILLQNSIVIFVIVLILYYIRNRILTHQDWLKKLEINCANAVQMLAEPPVTTPLYRKCWMRKTSSHSQ